jgi:hypothetical protein
MPSCGGEVAVLEISRSESMAISKASYSSLERPSKVSRKSFEASMKTCERLYLKGYLNVKVGVTAYSGDSDKSYTTHCMAK